MNNIPNELILHISSYLDPKYDNIKKNRNRCICYTKTSNYTRICKRKSKYNGFCIVHNSVDFVDKLCSLAV